VARSTTVRFVWRDETVKDDVEKALAAGLSKAGIHARRVMKQRLGGSSPSPEGSPPGKRTGTLQRSVSSRKFQRRRRYVGVDVGVPKKSPHDSAGKGKTFPGRMRAQAVRLASGFRATDRMGRRYNQGRRPFAEPVLASERQRMAEILRDTAKRYTPRAKKKG